MQIIKGKKRRPRRIILAGPHGIGKSTWASKAPNPLFVPTEDGLNDIGADRTPLIKSIGAFNGVLSDLIQQPHDYQTLVIDSLDWLERILFAKIASDAGKKSIGDIGYQNGYKQATAEWDFIVSTLETIRESRNMAIIIIAHVCTIKAESIDTDQYCKRELDLHKTTASLWQEWADEVLFADYKVNTIQKGEGLDRKRHIAIGGDRIVYTCERPTHPAKRRINMPDEIALDFPTYMHYVKLSYAEAEGGNGKNINGIVVDGSSKPKTEEEKEPVNV